MSTRHIVGMAVEGGGKGQQNSTSTSKCPCEPYLHEQMDTLQTHTCSTTLTTCAVCRAWPTEMRQFSWDIWQVDTPSCLSSGTCEKKSKIHTGDKWPTILPTGWAYQAQEDGSLLWPISWSHHPRNISCLHASCWYASCLLSKAYISA